MEKIFYLIKSLIKQINFIGGSVFCFFVISIFILFKIKIKDRISIFFKQLFRNFSEVLFVIFIITGIIYLFYPNFLNHVEPTIVTLGLALKKGEAVYPVPVGSYPYNGILYGPASFEIQMIFQSLGIPILTGSKLPGLIAFGISSFMLLKIRKDWIYRGYLLYLFSFGLMLFWNRPDSFLLSIVAITLFINIRFAQNKYIPLITGIFGGIASALKMHGFAYVFAAYLATTHKKISLKDIMLFYNSCIFSFFCFFLHIDVSFGGFWLYITSALTEHGLSFSLWLESFIYLVFLGLPFIIIRGFKKIPVINTFLLTIVEFLITIVASKHGNGFYHLLPLIPVNAFITLDNGRVKDKRYNLLAILYTCLIIVSLITVVSDFILPMGKSWERFSDAKKEVISISKKIPDAIMGVTDEHGYPYSFLRVLLKNRQIDYASFMDQKIAGIKDDALVENLSICNICCILMPNKGEPFTLKNYYTSKPLFSDKVRHVFAENFFLSEKGRYYSVYKCKAKDK